jgi:Protein of unknown function (DUF3667)
MQMRSQASARAATHGLDRALVSREIHTMSGELDAAGAFVTAGLAAGAIEGPEPGPAGEGPCLNCGVALSGAFCSACGQPAHSHRSLLHIVEELLFGLFQFDTKVWRTLPMVMFRPGTLTRDYIYGKRARYISPLALFLFTIFLMFFVFSFVDANVLQIDVPRDRAGMVANLTEARNDLAEAQRVLARAEASPGDPDTPGLEARLARQSVGLAQAELTRREQALARFDAAAAAETHVAAGEAPQGTAVTIEGADAASGTWQTQLGNAARNGDIGINTGFPLVDARILQSLENPDFALYKVQDAAYKYSFLLVPISLPFMWLLFIWRRGLTLYDHAVFILNGLSFASLLFIFLALCTKVSWLAPVGGTAFGLGLPVHSYFHLKGAYALGWWSAAWRSVLLLFFALICLVVFVVTIFVLGLAG